MPPRACDRPMLQQPQQQRGGRGVLLALLQQRHRHRRRLHVDPLRGEAHGELHERLGLLLQAALERGEVRAAHALQQTPLLLRAALHERQRQRHGGALGRRRPPRL
eukprot:scaffold6044_cov161-Prasinococcus_capsulatus_cf.AAC.1